jgi:DNA invertase Pin-like site-specific DNA recombinase
MSRATAEPPARGGVQPPTPIPGSQSAKIRPTHLERQALVYVRQSSPQQVLEHRESRERQYALAEHAVALGWASDRVLVIDEDQGQSGSSAADRPGFQRLLSEVTLDQVGIVLGLEMSRLARSSKDFHQLIEVCAIFGALLADQDGVYDPAEPNDRLLGLRGTISKVELHTMRNRLDRGRLNKAARGELFFRLPTGYAFSPTRQVVLEPDEQARGVVRLVFEKFAELGSVYAVFHDLIRHDVRLGMRAHSGPQRGDLVWQRPQLSMLYHMLHNPIYAGAYAYGRRVAGPGCASRAGPRPVAVPCLWNSGRPSCPAACRRTSAGSSTSRTSGGWRPTTSGQRRPVCRARGGPCWAAWSSAASAGAGCRSRIASPSIPRTSARGTCWKAAPGAVRRSPPGCWTRWSSDSCSGPWSPRRWS